MVYHLSEECSDSQVNPTDSACNCHTIPSTRSFSAPASTDSNENTDHCDPTGEVYCLPLYVEAQEPLWGEFDGVVFSCGINSIYQEILHHRKVFKITSGNTVTLDFLTLPSLHAHTLLSLFRVLIAQNMILRGKNEEQLSTWSIDYMHEIIRERI